MNKQCTGLAGDLLFFNNSVLAWKTPGEIGRYEPTEGLDTAQLPCRAGKTTHDSIYIKPAQETSLCSGASPPLTIPGIQAA